MCSQRQNLWLLNLDQESPTLSSGWSLSSVQYKTDNAWAKEGHLAILKMMVLDM